MIQLLLVLKRCSTGDNAIAIGKTAYAETEYSNPANQAEKNSGSIAIGSKAYAKGHGAIAIGNDTSCTNTNTAWSSVVIGSDSEVKKYDSISLGNRNTISSSGGVAIGNENSISGNGGYAFGENTFATAPTSYAIGWRARAKHTKSMAIGAGAETTSQNQIVLGDRNTTVYIPGNLVVGHDTWLGADDTNADNNAPVYIKFHMMVRLAEYAGKNNSLYHDDTAHAVNYSDRRLKNVGEKYTAGLEELKKLDFYHYTFKKDDEKIPHVGVMAQDLEKVFPDAVTKGEDGYLRIRMEDMFYAVINAVKELNDSLTTITQNINNIVKDVTTLKTTVENQQKTIEELKIQNQEIMEVNEKLLKRIEKLEKKKVKGSSELE